MKYSSYIAVLTLLVLPTMAWAQDDIEFQRIAKRVMNAYDIGDELAHAPDSSNWYGGAYLGASSQGRAMPSAYVTYLVKDKYLITANLSFDLGEKSTSRDIDNQFTAGGYLNTGTTFLTNTEKTDMSVRMDCMAGQNGFFSIGLLETYNREKVNENSIKSGADAQGVHSESIYEEQQREGKDIKFGSLLQYVCDFTTAGRLTTRLNIKYNSKPTTINDDTWSASTAHINRYQKQELKNFDPYSLIDFKSIDWQGFNFGVSEKYVLNNMTIDDSSTEFNYDTYSSLTTLSANYSHKWLSLSAKGTYELFQQKIFDHQNDRIKDTDHDWMGSGSMEAKLTDRHSLKLTYDRDIKRPTYTQLYPFVHIGSGIGAKVVGNTDLNPSCTQQYKLSHTFKGKHWTMTTGLAYKHTDDDITPVSSFDDATQTTVKTWVNDATYDNYRFTAEGRLLAGRWDVTTGFHAQYLSYSGDNVSGDETWSYSYKIRPQVSLPQDWILATSVVFTGREVHRTYYDRSNLYWSFRAVKQLGEWTLYAFVQDILQEDRVQVLKNEKNRTITSNDLNGRCLIVGCSYTF